MSTKKTVAIVDGKALNAPKTPEKQSSPPAEVKLDDKLVTAFLSDTNIYDLWKKLADGGGMKKPTVSRMQRTWKKLSTRLQQT